jgi:hypothetical protein
VTTGKARGQQKVFYYNTMGKKFSCQGPILQNFISAQNVSDKFSPAYFGQMSSPKTDENLRMMDNILEFKVF